MMFKEKEQAYKQEISELNNILQETKMNADQRQAELEREIKKLKGDLDGTSANLNNKADTFQAKNKAL